MSRFVALLRAVNVGGTGKLPMSDLRALCEKAGFRDVSTFIASGNALFESGESENEIIAKLETELHRYAGKPVGVLLRSAAEMAAIAASLPFPDAPGNRCLTIFLPSAPPADWREGITGLAGERLQAGPREIHVDYVGGIADAKLKIKAAQAGTARNMNSVIKLALKLA